MTVLLDRAVPRTLDALLARFGGGAHRGVRVDAWLFEDVDARRQAERRLAEAGVPARIRSAYKPLVHWFLEDAPPGITRARIRTPAHPAAAPGRFRLEAYPLARLLPGADLRFEPGDLPLHHLVVLDHAGGRSEHRVFAPNRVRVDHLGRVVLCPTGWLRTTGGGTPDGVPSGVLDGMPVDTEFEAMFQAAMDAVTTHAWGGATPLFDVLEIRVDTGGIERALDPGCGHVSTREALHEDLYFSGLEWFQRRAGRPVGDRTLRLGQIVPDVRPARGPGRVRVTLRRHDAEPAEADPPASPAPLDVAQAPLPPGRVAAELARLGGERFGARSWQGRDVPGVYAPGSGPGLVVTAGQHANEASGVVGALRAARALAERGVRFAAVPLENPDGYALHRRLCRVHPGHMHHAARHTALGDDLEAREAEPLFEAQARREAFRRARAVLHVSLHGYPAGEWIRPFTGYLPRGFEAWSIPRGFFLILRHRPALAAQAARFLHALAERLGAIPDLRAFNEAQLAAHRAHAGEPEGIVHHGIPCLMRESAGSPVPFTLVTEFPDETVYGERFRLAHEAHLRTVLHAAELMEEAGGVVA